MAASQRSESETSRYHALSWMHNHRMPEEPEPALQALARLPRVRDSEQGREPSRGRDSANSQIFCVNKQHPHFSKNTFPDCRECKLSSSNHSSNEQPAMRMTIVAPIERQTSRFLTTSNYLLSDSCSVENYGSGRSRKRAPSLELPLPTEQTMPAIPKKAIVKAEQRA